MKTEKTDNPNPSKPRGYRVWFTRLTLLLGLPLLLYFGYCWGLWGRGSLLLQYLFQCSCPAASEEARYPEYVDVIVPACKNQGSLLSPSGRLLYVHEEESGTISTYLLNFETDKKTPLTLPEGSNYFLTDDLIFHSFYGSDEFIWDIKTDKKYPIQMFASLRFDAYVNGELNLNSLAEALQEAEVVFLIDDDNIVALVSEFRNHPERNFNVPRGDFPGREANRVEQFLQQYSISHEKIYDNFLPRFPNEVTSPDGNLVARADGVYSVETGQQVVGEISSLRSWAVRGWIYNGSAVIYSHFHKPCVIETGIPGQDGTICLFKVPQPVLLLKAPEEYLMPATSP